eukprot:403376262
MNTATQTGSKASGIPCPYTFVTKTVPQFIVKAIRGPNQSQFIIPSAIALLLGYQITKYLVWKHRNRKLCARSRQILDERNAKTYKFIEVDQSKEDLILSLYSVAAIRHGYFEQKYTVEEVVTVFAKRCSTIGRRLCLSTVELIDKALETAKLQDITLSEAIQNGTTDQLPPLFGIPISVKDNINTKGDRNTRGAQYLQEYIAPEDALSVTFFKKAGAIILVKGNMGQVGFSIHTSNWIWGTAQNPHDTSRTCGGSTGGDAGLVAARCVPLALGADIGGSLRIPGAFNGVFAFKPSGQRCTLKGQMAAWIVPSTFNHILASQGPLAQCVDDLTIAFKLQLNPDVHHFDHRIVPSVFREEDYQSALNGGQRNMRIGYYQSLETVPASASVRRAVAMAKDALEKQGYELVPFTLSKEEILTFRRIMITLVANHTLGPIARIILNSNEELATVYRQSAAFFFLPNCLKHLALLLLKVTGNKRQAEYAQNCFVEKKQDLDSLVNLREQWHDIMRQKWNDLGIQALICPIYPHVAFKIKNQQVMNSLLDYSFLWNLLHYPAGSLPVTQVKHEETVDPETTYQDGFNDPWTKVIRDDIKDSAGMPISVQVVGRTHQDELVLGIMKAIDQEIGYIKKQGGEKEIIEDGPNKQD